MIQQACRAQRLRVTLEICPTAPSDSMHLPAQGNGIEGYAIYHEVVPALDRLRCWPVWSHFCFCDDLSLRVLGHIFHKNGAYCGDELDSENNAATPQMNSCMELILCFEAEISIEDVERISQSLFANGNPRLFRLTKYDHFRMTFCILGNDFGAAFLQEAV